MALVRSTKPILVFAAVSCYNSVLQTERRHRRRRERSMDEYQKACVAYERYCEQRDRIYQQPSWSLAEQDDEYVYLRNVNGELARYNIAAGRIEITAAREELA